MATSKTVKAVRAFGGSNTYGVNVEVAQSATGNWFQRAYAYNGYAKAWTKWQAFEPVWSTTVTNAYSGETEQREEPVLQYGWSVLSEYVDVPRYRLPA